MNDIKEELPLLVATVTSAALGIGVALFPPRLVVVVVVVALFRFDSAVVGVVLFYSVLGGFQRLSKEKQESVS